MRKIIISLAPIAPDAAQINPAETSREIVGAARAGAAMVHLHVKGRDGRLTKDLKVFKNIVESVCEKSDIVIEASTGGVSDLTIEERCAPLAYERVETASLNGGSCNLGEATYRNSFSDIRYCYEHCMQNGILPDFEVFEIGMINNIKLVCDKMQKPPTMLFNIVLGMRGVMPATIEALTAFKQFLPAGSIWGMTPHDRQDFLLLQCAIEMGASLVQVGLEDSPSYEKGEKAGSNVKIVERTASIIRGMGCEPATPEEARDILKIKPKR